MRNRKLQPELRDDRKVPTVGDFVPEYEASLWFGIAAPRNTPAGVVDLLNSEINAALAEPKIKSQLADMGGTAFTGSSAEFGKFTGAETEKWAKVIKFANVKPE